MVESIYSSRLFLLPRSTFPPSAAHENRYRLIVLSYLHYTNYFAIYPDHPVHFFLPLSPTFLLYLNSPWYHLCIWHLALDFALKLLYSYHISSLYIFKLLRLNLYCVSVASPSPSSEKAVVFPAHHLHARNIRQANSTAFLITIRFIMHNSFFFQRNIPTCSTTVTFYLIILLLQFI